MLLYLLALSLATHDRHGGNIILAIPLVTVVVAGLAAIASAALSTAAGPGGFLVALLCALTGAVGYVLSVAAAESIMVLIDIGTHGARRIDPERDLAEKTAGLTWLASAQKHLEPETRPDSGVC